jgi:hypothetical protein
MGENPYGRTSGEELSPRPTRCERPRDITQKHRFCDRKAVSGFHREKALTRNRFWKRVMGTEEPKNLGFHGWVERISKLTTKVRKLEERGTREVICQIGNALRQAREELTRNEYRRLVQTLKLGSMSTARNYRRICEKRILWSDEVKDKVPTAVGPMIDLAAWDDEEIEQAAADGVLKPDATRKELKAWRKLRHAKNATQQTTDAPPTVPEPEPEPESVLLFGVWGQASDWTPKQVEAFKWRVAEIGRKEFGRTVTADPAPEEAEAA